MPIGKCNFCIDSCGCYFYFLWFKKVRTTSLKLNVTKPNFYEIPLKKIGKILGLSTLSTSLPHIASTYSNQTITRLQLPFIPLCTRMEAKCNLRKSKDTQEDIWIYIIIMKAMVHVTTHLWRML